MIGVSCNSRYFDAREGSNCSLAVLGTSTYPSKYFSTIHRVKLTSAVEAMAICALSGVEVVVIEESGDKDVTHEAQLGSWSESYLSGTRRNDEMPKPRGLATRKSGGCDDAHA